ncbi:MAG TPA: hypothetical protein VGA08_01775, partial [Candidatus Saccharimonadales bacterium]
ISHTSTRISVTTAGILTLSGYNCSANANGGALTANSSGVISCTDDDVGTGTPTLDDAYNNFGATPSKITIDAAQGQTGGLEFELSATNNPNLVFDMQGSGDIIFQDASSAFLTLSDTGGFELTLDGTDNPAMTITNNGSSNVTYNLASTGDFVIQDNGTPVLTLADNGDLTYVSSTNGTTAFEIQNATGADTLFSADTSNNRVVIGNATGTGTSTTVLVVDSSTADPTGVNGAIYYNSTDNKFRCFENSGWTDCIDTGSVVTMGRIPEFSGGLLHADGSNNTGTMTADFVNALSMAQGEKHNYYQWSTGQASAQDYDIIVNVQIPSDFASIGAASTFKFWHSDPDGATTNAQTTWELYDQDETQCFSAAFNGASAGVWEQEAASSLSTCAFAAGDIITFVFKLSTTSTASNLLLGEFEFQYAN